MIRIFLALTLLFFVQLPAQPSDSPQELEVITRDNAQLLKQIQMLGRGGIFDLLWSPDGTTLAAMGANGVWMYDALNWDVPPYLLGETSYYVWAGDFSLTGQFLATTDRDGWRLWDVQANRLLRTVHQTRDATIQLLTLSPNGHLLATASRNRSATAAIIQLWDTSNGRELAYLEVRNAYRQVLAITFSPDGRDLLVVPLFQPPYRYAVSALLEFRFVPDNVEDLLVGYEAQNAAYAANGDVYVLYQLDHEEQQRQYVLQALSSQHPSVVTPIRSWYQFTIIDFDPDTGLLVASGELGEIEIYDIAAGELLTTLPGHEITSHISLDPTGKQLVSYGDGYRLKVWDLETYSGQLITDQHTRFGSTVTFHPNSEWLAFGTQIADGQIQLWDMVSGQVIEHIPGHDNGGWTTSIAFQSDGSRIASGSGIGCCPRIWDLKTRETYRSFTGHSTDVRDRGVNDIFLSQDNSLLVSSGGDGTVRLWDIETGEAVAIFDHGSFPEIRAAVMDAENRYMFAVTEPASGLHIWNIETGQEITHEPMRYHAEILILSKDRSLLAVITGNSIEIWNPTLAERLQQIDISGTAIGIVDAVISPDNTMIAALSSRGNVRLIDLTDGATLADVQVFDWLASSIDWSSDGQRIAVTGREGSVHLLGIPLADSPLMP
jgi:WD40 repeat protein